MKRRKKIVIRQSKDMRRKKGYLNFLLSVLWSSAIDFTRVGIPKGTILNQEVTGSIETTYGVIHYTTVKGEDFVFNFQVQDRVSAPKAKRKPSLLDTIRGWFK